MGGWNREETSSSFFLTIRVLVRACPHEALKLKAGTGPQTVVEAPFRFAKLHLDDLDVSFGELFGWVGGWVGE